MTTETEFGLLRDRDLIEEMKDSYMDYAMSVIVSRALPDVRDGLKPVQRRILYAMHELGMTPGSTHKKSARLVGEVLGKYHPHGDAPVYEAMVRMAQEFSMRVPLVSGQGNFGSIDGDPPAAMRYTEARLSRAAEELLNDLEQDTVNYTENFDGSLQEPSVLPAKLPQLLLNGTTGIAVGMATNIPPHNLGELCSGIVRLINDPDATCQELMRYVKGPDFPTAATIMGTQGIREAYETGRGSIVMRAVSKLEETPNSKRAKLVFTELPFQVNKSTLIEKMAILVRSKRIEGVTEIRDESNRKGIRIVLELRHVNQAPVILNQLYSMTPLQTNFSFNMLALANGTPKTITLKGALQYYIDFRREIVTRRAKYQLTKAQNRIHLLDGLIIALKNIDSIITLIRESQSVDNARSALMTWYQLDELQAQAILDMPLRRLAALEREKIENEHKELTKEIKSLQNLLSSKEKIDDIIKTETQAMRKKHADPRRTIIKEEVRKFTREELEAHESIVITHSQGGYIKRIPASTYRNQHRGGRGVIGMTTREDDPINNIIVGDTHDTLLFFTNRGRVLPLKAFELRPDTSRKTRGIPIANIIPVQDNEVVKSVVSIQNLSQKDLYLFLTTNKGSVKRISLEKISSIRKAGLIIMRLSKGENLLTAFLVNNDDDVIMVSESGQSIRFGAKDVTPRHRPAGGVRGMKMTKNDKIVSADKVIPDSKLLVVSKNGFGKLTDLNRYRSQYRAGSGIKTLNITTKTGKVAGAQVIAQSHEVYLVSKQAVMLRTNLSEIRNTGRATQGVTIFKLAKGDSVSSMACVGDLGDDSITQPKITTEDI